jgi:phosphohistidine phosphatase
MKYLILCRHSKPESPDLPKPDRDRELTATGKKEALAIGHALAERGLIPDAILSSDSRRTRQTTTLICKAFSVTPKISCLAELYSATGGTILDTAASYAADADTILVVGHNPGMEEAAWQLARKPVHLSTSTVAVFASDGKEGSEHAPLHGLDLREVFGPNGEQVGL